MRSLKYLPALLPLFSIGAFAEPEKDVWVVVTKTNTITVCPVTEWLTCDNDISTFPPASSTSKKPQPVTTTSGRGGHGGDGTSTSHDGHGDHGPSSTTRTSSSTSHGGPFGGTTSSTTTRGPHDGSSSTTSSSGTGSSTTTRGPHDGSSSTTSSSGTGSSTTTRGPHDGSSSTTSSSGTGSSTTTRGPHDGSSSTTSYDGTTTSSTTTRGPYDGSSSTTTTSHSLTSSTSTSSDNGTTTTHTMTSTTSGLGYNGTTSTTTHTLTSTTSGLGYNGTTTTSAPTTSLTTTSFYGNVSTSTTTSFATTTTPLNSTSTCGNTTHTATGLPEPNCNGPNSRSSWCEGKTVGDDTHVPYYSQQTKHFDLTITNTTSEFDGLTKLDFAINGQTPGPLIELNWGDIAVITVHNALQDNATTIHWHGIRQTGTNDQDGVPGITECGIAPGSSRTYTWHASTFGTGWYHGHTMAQYGGGVRGPLIVHGPATADYDLDLGHIMIDDVYERPMMEIAARAARFAGPPPVATNYLLNGKNKSPDGSKGENSKWILKEGKKHLVRIINSSAQGAYIVHLDGHKFTVISADFTPIVPYETEYLYIQGGQRYNVIVEANQPSSAYYFRAITQAGCAINNANSGLGINNGIFEYETSCGVTPSNSLANSTLPFNLAECQGELLSNLKPYVPKNAGSQSAFLATSQTIPGGNADAKVYAGYGPIVRWLLGGNGTSATNQLIANYSQPTLKTMATVGGPYDSAIYPNAIVLNGTAGAWVYFVIQNPFRTSHPMHLHGHDFSVLGQGKGFFDSSMVGQLEFTNPIRRDTSLLYGTISNPSGWTVIGFETDNPGAWIMHCHIIWHADGGMALQYIEQPDKAQADQYWGTEAFKDECSALTAYEAQGPYRQKHVFESGIKRRQHLDDHIMHAAHRDVVRHV